MKAICLIDTSVFVEFLNIPHMCNRHQEIVNEVQVKIADGESLFLPMATILESGNHIAQNGDGDTRRRCALRFVKLVKAAIGGEAPFTPINLLTIEDASRWLQNFPDVAMSGSGLGDLSIIHDWERLCSKNMGRRVYIWTLDEHLQGFEQAPRL